MDPAELPLELFMEILRYLPQLCVWQLRRTAKSWNTAMSTTAAVSMALQGDDIETFKKEFGRKPVSCIDLSVPRQPQRESWSFAFQGRHTAYLRSRSFGEYPREGHDITLFIHDIEGQRLTKTIQSRLKPSVVQIDEMVAFIADSKLHLFTLDGLMAVRPLPRKYRGGLLAVSKNKVVILRDRQNSNPAMIKQNTMWIYDPVLDNWTIQDVPQTRITSIWYQRLIVEDVVSIVSVGMEAPRTKDMLFDGCPYIVHVRAGQQSWSHEYTTRLTPSLYGFFAEMITPRWSGIDYDIAINSPHGCHTLTITPEKFISADAGHRARWHGTTFKGVEGGIETPIGFLWQDKWVPQRPTILLASEEYLVSLFLNDMARDTHICAFRMLGQRQDLLPLFKWEDSSDNRDLQIETRTQLFTWRGPYVIPGSNTVVRPWHPALR